MSAPFAPSPKLREYCDWARTKEGCKVESGVFGTKAIVRITAPSGRSVRQVGLDQNETVSHSVIAHLDRRLGLDSPFPKTPDEPT